MRIWWWWRGAGQLDKRATATAVRPWVQPIPRGPVVFDPSLRRARELTALSATRRGDEELPEAA